MRALPPVFCDCFKYRWAYSRKPSEDCRNLSAEVASLKCCRGRRCYAVGVFDPPPPAAGRGARRAKSSLPKTSAYNCPLISALRYLPFYFCLPSSAFLCLPSVLSVSGAYLEKPFYRSRRRRRGPHTPPGQGCLTKKRVWINKCQNQCFS